MCKPFFMRNVRTAAGIHEQQLVSAAQAVGLAIAGDYFEEYVGQVN